MYLCLGISLPCLFIISSELLCGESLEAFVILSAIILAIKLPVASAGFWIPLFEDVLSGSVADFF